MNNDSNSNTRICADLPIKIKKKLKHSAKKSGRTLKSELALRINHSLNLEEYLDKVPDIF